MVCKTNPLVEFLDEGLMEEKHVEDVGGDSIGPTNPISETCLRQGDLKCAHGGISDNNSGGSKQKCDHRRLIFRTSV